MLYKGKLIDGKIRFATPKEIEQHGSIEAAIEARKPKIEPKVAKKKAEKVVEEPQTESETPDVEQ